MVLQSLLSRMQATADDDEDDDDEAMDMDNFIESGLIDDEEVSELASIVAADEVVDGIIAWQDYQ